MICFISQTKLQLNSATFICLLGASCPSFSHFFKNRPKSCVADLVPAAPAKFGGWVVCGSVPGLLCARPRSSNSLLIKEEGRNVIVQWFPLSPPHASFLLLIFEDLKMFRSEQLSESNKPAVAVFGKCITVSHCSWKIPCSPQKGVLFP